MNFDFKSGRLRGKKANVKNDCAECSKSAGAFMVLGFVIIAFFFVSALHDCGDIRKAEEYTIAENQGAVCVSQVSNGNYSAESRIRERITSLSPIDVMKEVFLEIFAFGGEN